MYKKACTRRVVVCQSKPIALFADLVDVAVVVFVIVTQAPDANVDRALR